MPIAKTGNEIGSLRGDSAPGGIARECSLGLSGWLNGSSWFNLHRAGLDVDDHQLGRQAVQDEHDLVQADGLAGVDFRVIGAGAVVAIIAPHHFFIRRDFGDVLHPGEKDVAVGKHPHIVVFVARCRSE